MKAHTPTLALSSLPADARHGRSRRAMWRQLCFGWLNLVLTAPSVYLWLGLPLVLRQHGWSGGELGLFQLAGVPAVFKILLAMPIDGRQRGRGIGDGGDGDGNGGDGVAALGRYRRWAIALCLLFAAMLLLIGRVPLMFRHGELFILALLAALLATWADVPVNALAIRLLPESERLRAGGIRSAALSLGAIVGGGLMLLAHTQWGWRAPFWSMAIGLLSGAGLLYLLKPDDARLAVSIDPPPIARTDWRGYFTQPAGKRWNLLLLSCFPVIGAAWFYLKPLMLDAGFAPAQVAALVGIGGGMAAAVAGMLTPLLGRRCGIGNTLSIAAALCATALAALTLAVWCNAGPAWMAVAALMVACAMGCMAAVAFGLMMYFVRAGRSAMDYGTQASLFAVGRIAVPLLAGVLLDRLGYAGMLGCLSAAMLAVLLLSLNSRGRIAAAVELRGDGG